MRSNPPSPVFADLPPVGQPAAVLLGISSVATPVPQQLTRVLHLLNVTAVVLAVLLVLILLLALWVYRRNTRKEPGR